MKVRRSHLRQNWKRSEACICRGGRVDVTCPNVALICWPAGLNRAVVSTAAYCVWLKTL